MQRGKKSTAESIVYDAMDIIETNQRRNPVEIFEQAMRNATPMLEVKPRRVGGATYQVPVEIKGDRRTALAMRWLIAASAPAAARSMAEKLAGELDRCRPRPGRDDQAARGYPPNGRGEPGVLALPLVVWSPVGHSREEPGMRPAGRPGASPGSVARG